MFTKVFWVTTSAEWRLGISPRPRGGDWLEDEISVLAKQGVDVVLSLLERGEISELDLLEEEKLCEKADIAFFNFAIQDRCVPASIKEFTGLIRSLRSMLADGKTVVIHCRQGIGRASIVAASILASSTTSADLAFQWIAAARGREVPDTVEQRLWVRAFVKSSDLK